MSEHDPHCPQSAPPSMTTALCFCALIAKVREDERGRAALEIASKTNEHYAYGRADALTQMLEAGNVMGQEFYAKGRADALDAARDAIPAPRYDGEWRVKYAEVIAAIDALKEKR